MRGNTEGVATPAIRRGGRWFPLIRVTGIAVIGRIIFAVMLVGYMLVNECTCTCTCKDETECMQIG
jgi:hypothetical protein